MTREDHLAELLERWEDTKTHSRTLTPEDLCRDCPDLLDDFRRLLNQLGAVNAVLAHKTPPSAEELLARVEAGRYRALSFHAQGGLGLVFVAEDQELRRNVALKCMQELAAADRDARSRFLLEAEITSKLEHPGVVPVHGFGRDARGQPYYAMRFIHGNTLGDAIERYHNNTDHLDAGERNVELRGLIRRFVVVCETMAYAHARGVIHRDLKPSNIMLGAYGETLVVDWGLAKRLKQVNEEPSDPALAPLKLLLQENGETVLGDVRGSPAFMSPEQARGDWDRVGPASDVYSLGATLYVLLTGNKPYDGRGAMEVMSKVKRGDCPPPRQVNAAVPLPLDAVCRKAMAFDPAARYAGAAELARDLERWLADEPVTAWREPPTLRARRWLRRHQTLTTTTVVTFLVAFVIISVAGFWLDRQRKELQRTNGELVVAKTNLEQANTWLEEQKQEVDRKNTELVKINRALDVQTMLEKRQRLLAEQNLLRACLLFYDVLDYTSSVATKDRFQNDPTYQRLLEKFVHDADDMLKTYPDNPAVLQFAARSHLERAHMARTKGLSKEINDDLEAARQYFGRLRAQKPDDPMLPGRLGQINIERALRAYDVKDYKEAVKAFTIAYDTILSWAGADRARDGGLNAAGLYLVCQSLCELETIPGVLSADAVIERLQKAIAALEPAGEDQVNVMQRTFFAANLRMLLAEYLDKRGDQAGAVAVLERALPLVEKRDADDPYAQEVAMLRWRIPVQLATVEWQRSRKDASVRRMESAVKAFTTATDAYPQAITQPMLETIPLALASATAEKAKELDRTKPHERAEQRRLIGEGLAALDWMERALTARKLTITPNSQTLTAALRKQLEQLRKE